MNEEKYKILEGGKITFAMPEVTVEYYDSKHERHAEILAELISREINKPEFVQKMTEAVNETVKNLMNQL